MEAIDNLVVVFVPGTLEAGVGDGPFWWSIAAGLAAAYPFAFPAQRALIRRGMGRAHGHHEAGVTRAGRSRGAC